MRSVSRFGCIGSASMSAGGTAGHRNFHFPVSLLMLAMKYIKQSDM